MPTNIECKRRAYASETKGISRIEGLHRVDRSVSAIHIRLVVCAMVKRQRFGAAPWFERIQGVWKFRKGVDVGHGVRFTLCDRHPNTRLKVRRWGYMIVMTCVLIAVDHPSESLYAARRALTIFGESAQYIVINVADDPLVAWGNDTLMWGLGYPLMAMPIGGSQSTATHADGSRDSSKADPLPWELAQQTAEEFATQAHLPDALPVGEVGDPAFAIMSTAHKFEADVIVVSSHERSWLSRLFTPSVSHAVTRESDIPVLIINSAG